MNYVSGPGLNCIYNSDWSTEQPLSGTNSTVITLPFKLATASGCSVHIVSDGGAAINYQFQVTNFPSNFADMGSNLLGRNTRDDSVSSPFWQTTPSGTGSIPQASGSTYLLLDKSIARNGRIVFMQTAGSGKIVALLATAE